jgi:GPI mannosyltransferase 3
MYRILETQNGTISDIDRNVWWTKIHFIAFIGLLLRLIVALVSDTIYHPDELIQYMEQAHRLEFGYGIIPWEYRYGIRSWILPGLISGLLHIFRVFNIDNPSIYTLAIKILFCVLSISLIYASYIVARNISSEKSGRIAAVITSFWYELIYFSSKPTPEVISAYLIVLAMACIVVKPTKNSAILFGLFCGLTMVLRFQYSPLVFILIIFTFFKWRTEKALVWMFFLLSTVVVSGYIDYLTWGSFFASYYNNYLYNSVYKVSEIFGVEPPYYFLTSGVFFLFLIGCVNPSKIRQTWLPLLCILSVIISHSLVPHKEYRFIFAAIPFCLIVVSIVISDYAVRFKHWYHILKKISFYFIASLIICLLINSVVIKIPLDQPILPAYLFLNKEADLVSVFNNYGKWGDSGGYYYLHRNIPVYYSENLEYRQIDDYSLYVSHIICNKNQKPNIGFTTIFSYRDLEIRKVTKVHSQYEKLDIDTFNPLQIGVDGKFQSTVKPHLK